MLNFVYTICTDFNLPNFDWNTDHDLSVLPNIEACFAKFIIDNGITQLIRSPRASIIYLVYNSLTTLSLCLTFRSYSRLVPATTVQLPGKHGSRAILALRARITSILFVLTIFVLIVI